MVLTLSGHALGYRMSTTVWAYSVYSVGELKRKRFWILLDKVLWTKRSNPAV
jgi:hypothetical protein